MNGSDRQKPIRSAVILSRVYHRPVSGAIREIAGLLDSMGVEACLDQNTAVGFDIRELRAISRSEMRTKDLFIVVGGDGSLLGAARTLVDLRVPMLGVNAGHLGLLTDLSPEGLKDRLKDVVAGKYSIEERTMLDLQVFREDEDGAGELVGQSLATNETVIHSGMMAHMMTFKVFIDGRYMYTLRGDGIIVNTPTGSTAYSLSAGGSIIEPHLDVLALVPMFPQSLNCSPIIIPGKSAVRIDFDAHQQGEVPELVAINCDGQVTMRADTKCTVSIRQHRVMLKLIHPEGYDYYSLLRQKLGWGQSLV
jgi:NAD+ kinase